MNFMSTNLEEMSAFFNDRAAQYDEVHIGHIESGAESKRVPALYLPESTRTLLDLGIGTGLELNEIYGRFPDIRVTGYDIAKDMLERLKEKFPDKAIDLRNESYLTADLGQNIYDAAMSVMSLHHYEHKIKTALYRKIYDALRPNGVYIECDYMLSKHEYADPQATENAYFAQYKRLRSEQRLDDNTEYHFDTPCTVENQKKMLSNAGFQEIKEVWQVKNAVVLSAVNRSGDV
jgi:tRNA (cmo5U34)-methyltransferase